MLSAAEGALHTHPLGDHDVLGIDPLVVGVTVLLKQRFQLCVLLRAQSPFLLNNLRQTAWGMLTEDCRPEPSAMPIPTLPFLGSGGSQPSNPGPLWPSVGQCFGAVLPPTIVKPLTHKKTRRYPGCRS
jgi:hypothetical protein